MGSIDITIESLDDFKPWTGLNQSYIDTFDDVAIQYYNVSNNDPYDEGEWTNETLSQKVYSKKHGAHGPWSYFFDETIFETERAF